MPCALALLGLFLLVGPPLGRVLFRPSEPVPFFPVYGLSSIVRPEPTEHARYLLALLGPLLLALVVIARRRGPRPQLTVPAEQVSRTLLLAFVALCVLAQRGFTYDASYSGTVIRQAYFTWVTLVAAVALGYTMAVVLRSAVATNRLARLVRETRGRQIAAAIAAFLYLTLWLLSAFNTEGTLGKANASVIANIFFWLDEPMSILNGQAPLVDFQAQYGQLWAYLVAGPMSVLGTSFGVYATVMAIGTVATLFAVYAIFRRLTRNSLIALALFIPFVAHGFFMEVGPLENRYGPANLYSLFPIRYSGAYLLAWMVARHLGGARPRSRWLLFAVAGLVAINNLEFGLPAFGATLAAIIWTDWSGSLSRIGRVLGEAALGLVAAGASVALLTLSVTGSLPDFGMLLTFPRIYGIDGFGMQPMPTLGLHLVLYVTFAAALVVATVRTVTRDADVLLTGMLAWSSVFGLGASGYFVGRSNPDVLISVFSAWSFTLALLLLVSVSAILRRRERRPTAAELAVLVGFGLMLCSLAQTPTPSSQIARLRQTTAEPRFIRTATERFIDANTRRGEVVAILVPLAHRIAYDIGVRNVAPYANAESMPSKEQWSETIDALRAAHGRKLFIPRDGLVPERLDAVRAAGFAMGRVGRAAAAMELIDRRTPAAAG